MATNQDRINEIYNSSDDPWSTHGDELNNLVKDRGGQYTGSGNNNSGGNDSFFGQVVSDVGAAFTGIKNDLTMGAYDLFWDDAKMIQEFGQEKFDTYRANTAITAAATEALRNNLKTTNPAAYNALSDDVKTKYDALESVGYGSNDRGDNNNSSEASEVTGLDLDGDGVVDVEELTYAEQILKWAKESGVLKKQEDIDDILQDPNKWMQDNGFDLKTAIPDLDPNAEGVAVDPDASKFQLDDLSLDPATVDINEISTVSEVNVSTPVSYDVTSAASGLNDTMMVDPVQGEIDSDNLVNAESYTIDLKGKATGIQADGSIDYTGQALNQWASQDFSHIIDTSIPSGRALAEQLGEGNYVDKKATTAGQIEILSRQFINDNGEYQIPIWARGLAKSVNGTLNIGGAASNAAMSQAIMSSVIQIADKDAKFFQDLTIENLSNRQAALINKATVLANFDTTNLNARQTAAVENAKAFLQMDIKNLTNQQQAEVINKAARVQALFDDVKAVNAEKAFEAANINDFNKFYSELNVAIQRHNSAEINSLKKFNAGEINDAAEFVMQIKNSRDQFYQTMQYNIDRFNASWRQDVTLKEFDTLWEATTEDVKNTLGLTTELHNQIWDDADSMLDMIAKMSESEQDRILRLTIAQIQAQSGRKSGNSFLGGLISLGSAFLSTSTGSTIFAKAIGLPV